MHDPTPFARPFRSRKLPARGQVQHQGRFGGTWQVLTPMLIGGTWHARRLCCATALGISTTLLERPDTPLCSDPLSSVLTLFRCSQRHPSAQGHMARPDPYVQYQKHKPYLVVP